MNGGTVSRPGTGIGALRIFQENHIPLAAGHRPAGGCWRDGNNPRRPYHPVASARGLRGGIAAVALDIVIRNAPALTGTPYAAEAKDGRCPSPDPGDLPTPRRLRPRGTSSTRSSPNLSGAPSPRRRTRRRWWCPPESRCDVAGRAPRGRIVASCWRSRSGADGRAAPWSGTAADGDRLSDDDCRGGRGGRCRDALSRQGAQGARGRRKRARLLGM
jgi:hypothetical protein